MKIIELKCPNCGGPLQIPADKKVLYCQHCGTKLLLDDGQIYVNITKKVETKSENVKRIVDEAKIEAAKTDRTQLIITALIIFSGLAVALIMYLLEG